MSSGKANAREKGPTTEAAAVLDQAILGLEFGCLPHKLMCEIVDLAETNVICATSRPPDIRATFRRLAELLGHFGDLGSKEVWRKEVTQALRRTEQRALSSDFMSHFAAVWRSTNRTTSAEAKAHQWKGDHPYLSSWLAVHPEANDAAWEAELDKAYLTALDPTRRGKRQFVKRITKLQRKMLDGPPHPIRPPAMLLPMQWDIAGLEAQVQRREEMIRVSGVDRLLERLDRMTAGSADVFRRWYEIGKCLGQGLVDSWCPRPSQFVDYLPKSLGRARGYEEVGLPSTDELIHRWQAVCGRLGQLLSARDSARGLPRVSEEVETGEESELSYRSSEVDWAEYIAHFCAKRQRWLRCVLATMNAFVRRNGCSTRLPPIPPALMGKNGQYVVLLKDSDVVLSTTESEVVAELMTAEADQRV